MMEMNQDEASVNRRILIIDDNASIHDDYRKILGPIASLSGLDAMEAELFGETVTPAKAARPSFVVSSAMQGQHGHAQVVAALKTNEPFALAFVDMRMPPGWDGLETTKNILQDDPDIQVVICTAYSDYSWDELTQQIGTTDRVLILKKPFDTVEVTQLAQTLCRKWTLARMARNRMDVLEALVAERVQDLAATNSQLSTLIRVSPVGIFVLDKTGIVRSWNPAAERIFGWNSSEVIGQSLPNSMPAHLRVRLQSGEKIPAHDDLKGTDLHVKRKDGVGIEIATYTATLRTVDDHADGFIVMVAYITARKQVESELRRAKIEAEAAANAKSEFLATMSHEIRTPMNGVMGMAELLMSTTLDAEQRDFTETIYNSGEALLTIINDILDYSKIEAGMLALDPIPYDLQVAVYSVVDLLASRAEAKGLELIYRFAPNLVSGVLGDAGRVRQILTNLIGNAIKFTLHGHVFVDVSQHEVEGKSRIRFAIHDTGVGIPTEKLGQLFQKFTQADSSTTRQFGGTGLGLAISRQLAGIMDGNIFVTSESGKGSTFTLEIPLICDPHPVRQMPMPGDLSRAHILIIEPNQIIGRVLEEQIKSWGGVNIQQLTVAQMLAWCHRYGKDCARIIVILDANLIEHDVMEVAQELRKMTCSDIMGLVLLTLIGKRGDSRKAIEVGFNAYLTKPVHPEDLRDGLNLLCSEKLYTGEKLVTRHSLAETRGHISSTSRRRIAVQAMAEIPEGPKVLVVEDNAVNCTIVCCTLERMGCQVSIATNGAEAVANCLTKYFDLIFMDYHLPEMDGVQATKIIRNRMKDRHVPIIAMSASVLDEDRALFHEAGMDGLVTKPIRLEEIERAITNHVLNKNGNTDTSSRITPSPNP